MSALQFGALLWGPAAVGVVYAASLAAIVALQPASSPATSAANGGDGHAAQKQAAGTWRCGGRERRSKMGGARALCFLSLRLWWCGGGWRVRRSER